MKQEKTEGTEQNKQTIDSRYIQQHLANERTFLAWLRTAIAIIGVGFLVTNLHFTMKTSLSPFSDLLASIIGLSSVGLGIVTIIMATVTYFKKTKTINDQSFRTTKTTVVTLAIFVITIAIVFGVYFIYI
ncbi:putative membrane protein [Bacillus tianshenii]|uniref:Membrane protein n=1 Tax=Sutcliffiella tianshenii TaxID=1463404 RepID=A0ABS2P542_9BACI|nr:DUF202 domain-containing protein [Bacillus tianshenii]MBM7622065.1 putative membrane protein [Bacillus tianshenii]